MINPKYINSDGFVTVQPNAETIPGDGNGWLQTGLAIACGMYTPPNGLIDRCIKDPSKCPLIWRSPYKHNPGDQETCDDYWGALLYGSREWAKELLAWGRSHWWVFDVTESGTFYSYFDYWFPRFIPFVAFLKNKGGEDLNWFDMLTVKIALWYATRFNSKADGNAKTFCMIRGLEDDHPKVKEFADKWRVAIRKKYGTLGGSWSAYFGKDHDLSKYD